MISAVGCIPIGVFQWDQFETYKDKIIDLCLAKEQTNTIESNIGKDIKNNIWESKFDFLQNKECVELNNWLVHSTQDFLKEINGKTFNFGITESWAHVTRQNGYHGPHRHTWSTWSGIFYVEADKPESGRNTFWNYYNLPQVPEYSFFNEEFYFDFVPGRLIIFPSTMLHDAKPYSGNQRIVIAYNGVCI